MGNPSMRKIVRNVESEQTISSEQATYGGIATKTLLFGGVTVIAAIVSAWLLRSAFANQDEMLLTVMLVGAFVCVIPMLILSLVAAFAPQTVKVVGFIYSLLQGGLLGVVVFFVDAFYPGIAFAAVLGTLIVFGISVALNKLLEVRVGSRFLRGLFIAFFSLIALELVLFVVSLFVADFQALFTTYLWVQLGISLFCVAYATVMLLWDLQAADSIVNMGADKRYEWQVAFSLITTLVYMYIEILELLLRLLLLFGNRNN